MIRWMRGGGGSHPRYIFARGNLCECVYLLFRGYRPHETMLGWVMAKIGRRDSGGQEEGE